MTEKEMFAAEKITGRITRIILPGDVFSYLAVGEDRAALIDTGFGFGPLREYVEKMLSGKPYDVILTHGHLDHAGGASEFESVRMHPADLPVARKHTGKKMRRHFLKLHEIAAGDEDLAGEMEDGYLPLEYAQVFDLGNYHLEIVDLGGHTPGSIGVLFREDGILLAGDACCSYTLLFGKGQSLGVSEYRSRLIRTKDAYFDRIDGMLYSHPHNYGGKEIIPQMIRLCDDILAGRDDHIESPGVFDAVTFIARETGADGRRKDGKIANLQYSPDCLMHAGQ